jgi:hypothetical protein
MTTDEEAIKTCVDRTILLAARKSGLTHWLMCIVIDGEGALEKRLASIHDSLLQGFCAMPNEDDYNKDGSFKWRRRKA